MNVYLTSLGRIATFNGGLTNSAIKRIQILSENLDGKFFIYFCSDVEPTEEIVSFYKEKYKLNEKVTFINVYDEIAQNSFIKDNTTIHFSDGTTQNYFEYTANKLSQFIENIKYTNCYLFLDVVFFPDYRLAIKGPNIYKFFICHSNHMKSHKEIDWKISPYTTRGYFQPFQDPNTVSIFLTKTQLNIIKQKEGDLIKYKYLPHVYESKENQSDIKRENKIVILSRIAKEKRIYEFLQEVKERNLSIPIEIYGAGPAEESIKDYIRDENLQNVKFLGFTTDSSKIFASAKLSINNSEFEGFGLSILESLSNGCPVISSDVIYGPKELIRHNENGFLIKENESFVDYIEKFFKEDMFEKMSINAKKTAENYTKEAFLNRWKNILFDETLNKGTKITQKLKYEVYVKHGSLVMNFQNTNAYNIKLRLYSDDLRKLKEISLKDKNEIKTKKIEGYLLSIYYDNKYDSLEEELPLQAKVHEKNYMKYYNKVYNKLINKKDTYKFIEKTFFNNSNKKEKFVFIKFIEKGSKGKRG